ncbi:MAG: N-acetylneuraminate synthase family protein [Acidimicrobiales bacterium]
MNGGRGPDGVERRVDVAGRLIGSRQPCFVIAEAGVNHNGDTRFAHDLIDVAADGGADAVKFQTLRPAAMVSAHGTPAPYQADAVGAMSQLEMLEQLRLPDRAWAELAAHARERGVLFLSTAFDVGSADLLDGLGVPAFKVPSGELDNLAFIADLARRGRPLLISTGMGTMGEVASALATAAAAPGLALFHCVTAYPAPAGDANLRAIATMRREFGVPVGWSDHTQGHVTAVAAVALGASLLEKHVTLDRSLPGPDHAASADPEQFRAYVAAIRETERALGDGAKRPTAAEEENRVHARRSLHAAIDLEPGHRLSPSDVTVLRPAIGLPPGTDPTGLVVLRAVRAGEPITADSVDVEERFLER